MHGDWPMQHVPLLHFDNLIDDRMEQQKRQKQQLFFSEGTSVLIKHDLRKSLLTWLIVAMTSNQQTAVNNSDIDQPSQVINEPS